MSMATAGRIKKLENQFLDLKQDISNIVGRIEKLREEILNPPEPEIKPTRRGRQSRDNGQRANR